MLTAALLLLGGVLLLLALSEQRVRPWPMSPALIYLLVGWAGATWLGGPEIETLTEHAASGVFVTELAVLVSLFAVGLRLLLPPTFKAWRVALLLAGPGMVVTIVLAMLAAHLVLGLPWPAALLLASVVAPTDPVLASDVQIESSEDRDAVRLSLTAEGGMNDGGALPGVMLALGLLGLHGLGDGGARGGEHADPSLARQLGGHRAVAASDQRILSRGVDRQTAGCGLGCRVTGCGYCDLLSAGSSDVCRHRCQENCLCATSGRESAIAQPAGLARARGNDC